MADQDNNQPSGPQLADPPGGDNSNFPAKVAKAALSVAPGALPVLGAARAVGRLFNAPQKRDDIAD